MMLVVVAVSCWQTSLRASQAMHALVIGNNDYRSAPLKNPINDSHLITEVLESTGFQVTRLENLSKRKMEEAIADFQNHLPADSVALIYYAGHGAQDKDGKSYLVPIDATLRTGADLPYQAVAVDYYRDVLQDSPSKLNIVILDCCRDKIFSVVRAFRAPSARLSPGAKGSVIVYSTSAGKNAADGSGEYSPFAHHLAQSIRRGTEDRFSLIQVLQLTGRKVAAEIDQQPAVEFDLTSPEFYFVKHRNTSASSTLTAKLAPSIGRPLSSTAPITSSQELPFQLSTEHWKSLLSEADGCMMSGDCDRAIPMYTDVIQVNAVSTVLRERAYRGRSQAYLSRRRDIDDFIAAANDLQSIGEKGFIFSAPRNLALSIPQREEHRVNKHDSLLITKADPGKKWLWVESVNQDSERRGWVIYGKLFGQAEPEPQPAPSHTTIVSHFSEHPAIHPTIQATQPGISYPVSGILSPFESHRDQRNYPQPDVSRSVTPARSMQSYGKQFSTQKRGGRCHNCIFGRR